MEAETTPNQALLSLDVRASGVGIQRHFEKGQIMASKFNYFSMLFLMMALWIAGHSACADDATPPSWNPTRTWVFAISSTEWKYDRAANMPKKGRLDSDLIAALEGRGVPKQQIVFLKDKEGTLANIHHSFVELMRKTQKEDTLFFYFNGHGSRDVTKNYSRYYFVNYDATDDRQDSFLYMSQMLDKIEQHFRGSRVWLTADCCCSGGMIGEVKKRDGRMKYGCLTSVSAHNGSTGDWTYTRCLIRGLKGDGRTDLNGDGQLEFGELGRYIEREMAFIEQQKSQYYFSDGFDPKTRIGEARPLADPALGKHLQIHQDGEWFTAEVIAVKDGQYRVAYNDYDEKEWVDPKRTRPYKPQEFVVGAKIDAKSEEDDKWHAASVLKTYYGLHLVRFDNMSAARDEWMPRDRIKPRK